MITVSFVCLGNICRSPMAEAVFLRLVEERGFASSFRVYSFATSDCEEGNPVYPPAQAKLKSEGYDFKHTAKQISLKDIKNSDYVLIMDGMNLRDIIKFTGGNYENKIMKLGDFLDPPHDIADPWYTRDFDKTYSEIYSACNAFLDYLSGRHGKAFFYDKVIY